MINLAYSRYDSFLSISRVLWEVVMITCLVGLGFSLEASCYLFSVGHFGIAFLSFSSILWTDGLVSYVIMPGNSFVGLGLFLKGFLLSFCCWLFRYCPYFFAKYLLTNRLASCEICHGTVLLVLVRLCEQLLLDCSFNSTKGLLWVILVLHLFPSQKSCGQTVLDTLQAQTKIHTWCSLYACL